MNSLFDTKSSVVNNSVCGVPSSRWKIHFWENHLHEPELNENCNQFTKNSSFFFNTKKKVKLINTEKDFSQNDSSGMNVMKMCLHGYRVSRSKINMSENGPIFVSVFVRAWKCVCVFILSAMLWRVQKNAKSTKCERWKVLWTTFCGC